MATMFLSEEVKNVVKNKTNNKTQSEETNS